MRILLVTDSHLAATHPAQSDNWAATRALAARGDFDLTVHLGDITRDGWSVPDELPFAAAEAADWPTPIRFIPGNHDVGDNPMGPGEVSRQPLSREHLAFYRQHFGEDRWAIDTEGTDDASWRLIGLNAQLFGTDLHEEKAQWEWLADAVEDAGGRPVVVFSHKPFFQNDPEAEPPHIRYVPNEPRRRLRALFSDANLAAWISGHTHQLYDRQVGATRHLWVPSIAYRFPEAMQETIGQKFVGAAALTLAAGQLSVDLVIPEGVRQFELVPAAA